MNPNAQVADLIMQLMMRGKAGGLPMQASPELTQYLAHAQGGTTPPQLRGQPAAEVLQGPGSGAAAIRDPNFLSDAAPQPQALDTVSDRLPSQAFRQESPGEFANQPIFIWYTNPKTGKRIKLDGPFTDDLSARRAFNELREAGMTDPLEISPY